MLSLTRFYQGVTRDKITLEGVKRMAMSRKGRVGLGIGVIVAAVAALVYFGFSGSNSSYYRTVSEILADPASFQNQSLRISGYLVGDSIDWDSQNVVLRFALAAEQNDPSSPCLNVVYKGIKPNNFEHGNEVIIEGTMDQNAVVTAEKLMVKCPSKYEEQ